MFPKLQTFCQFSGDLHSSWQPLQNTTFLTLWTPLGHNSDRTVQISHSEERKSPRAELGPKQVLRNDFTCAKQKQKFFFLYRLEPQRDL